MKRLISVVLSLVMLVGVLAVPVFAETADGVGSRTVKEGENASYNLVAEESAGYFIKIEYIAVSGRSVSPKAAVTVDSAYSGDQKDVFEFSRVWSDVRKGKRFKTDDFGNELSPSPKEMFVPCEKLIYPQDENRKKGYILAKGNHTVNILMLEEGISILSVSLVKADKTITYSEYLAAQKGKVNNASKEIFKEAELLYQKSHLEIAVNYDRTYPDISPNSPEVIKYNIIGGGSWLHSGQWISYEVDVKESGFYYLNLRYRQRTIDGITSRRKIYIDDKVPFEELNCVCFDSAAKFTDYTLGDGEKGYKIYLSKGKHTVKFEVTLDTLEDIILDFENILDTLNKLSSKINVIIGESADVNRDYNFSDAIPDLSKTLKDSSDGLKDIIKKLKSDEAEGSQIARIKESARLLFEMSEKPNDIAGQMEYFRSQLYDLAAVLSNMKTQPLELDYFKFVPCDSKVKHKKASFFDNVKFRALSFLYSFTGEYNSISNGSKESIDAWINLGRDQAQVLNQLIKEDFTAKTGINVKLSLVTTNIMTAIASGRAPDVALYLTGDNIADLYYRDALVDMSKLCDTDKILPRFHSSATSALKYNGSVYALPLTQSYQMMFYRTDIFKEYGYKVPKTWEETYALLNLMQNDGMQLGIGITEETFNMFLLQSGISLYNDKVTKTNLTDIRAVNAFTSWTELFTKYGIPKSYDAVNRFRTGQMPLVINDYTFYKTVSISAPEIKNSFAMAPIPGTLRKDGSLSRAQNSINLTGVAIIKKKNKKSSDYSGAMKFADWLTTDGVQEKYSFYSEIRVGISARVQTANLNVMDKISWSGAELSALKEQWKSVEKIPISPIHYYITRNLNNAFRKVVYNYESPRDVIYRYDGDINEELTRKREELGLED